MMDSTRPINAIALMLLLISGAARAFVVDVEREEVARVAGRVAPPQADERAGQAERHLQRQHQRDLHVQEGVERACAGQLCNSVALAWTLFSASTWHFALPEKPGCRPDALNHQRKSPPRTLWGTRKH